MDDRVVSTIKKVIPAVVSIAISKHLEDLEKQLPVEMFPFLPDGTHAEKLQIPEELVDGQGMVQIGGGSGFIVDPSGIIITNKHVIIDPQAQYTVITENGRKYEATVLTRDPINDVAILKISAEQLPVIDLGDASKVELGQTVVAIGNALGIFKNTVSAGIISGLSRSIPAQADPKAPPQELRGLIQTDAAINPGNSGGPLVDMQGRAVGINVAIVYGAQNIGLAIPINAARRDLEDLHQYGRIRRPYLGFRYVIIDERLQSKMNLPADYGALVVRESQNDHGVMPHSPAHKAGIRERDIILECNGEKLTRDHSIQDCLEDKSVGERITLKIWRQGDELLVPLTLAERK